MLEPRVGDELSLALVNALLLTLWAVLPALVLGFARQSLAARRMRPEFSLRKSEAAELNRAVHLYAKVCGRLAEIVDPNESPKGFWRNLVGSRADVRAPHAEELEDLEAHAEHLRSSIVRLKRRPLQRFRSWVRVRSSQFAFGRALAAHVVGFVLLVIALRVSEQPAWADELKTGTRHLVVWYPLDARLFYANAIAASFAAVTGAVFYLVRWVGLHRQYGLEFCACKEFADADPEQLVARSQAGHADEADAAEPQHADATGEAESWFSALGLANTANIDEVKEAYKALIKQNHPDRVHGLSPALRKLAEAETKKLNAAYQQALFSISPLPSEPAAADH